MLMERIFYYCSANPTPTGGNKITYRHVEILCDLGFDAAVVHPKAGFRYDSINHASPVVALGDMRLTRRDVLVFPEDAGPNVRKFAPAVRKVLFNQNAYHSFRGFADREGALPPYRDPVFVATLVVSEDNRRYLEYAFPGLQCRRIHISLDFKRFSLVPASQKHNHIAFMTRKNGADVAQVLQILRSRNVLQNWKLTPIENQDEAGVARIMGEAKIFLAFGHPEGISLSNLEAMARGCRVIGYSGMGCREYFADDLCVEVPMGDIIAFVRVVEAEIARFDAGSTTLLESLGTAARYVQEHYSPEAERADLLDVFSGLMAAPG